MMDDSVYLKTKKNVSLHNETFISTLVNLSASLLDGLVLSTHRAEKAYDG